MIIESMQQKEQFKLGKIIGYQAWALWTPIAQCNCGVNSLNKDKTH